MSGKNMLLAWLLLALSGCTTIHTGYVEVSGGGRVYYEDRGKGEILLLLHGHSLDRRMWHHQSRFLTQAGYRTVCMDFRGYGRSSAQSETLLMTHADDVLTLMDSLRVEQAHVVGLSMGAFVAGDLLGMHPERLLCVVMASGGVRRSSPGPNEPVDSTEWARREQEIAEWKTLGVDSMKRRWMGQLMASGGSQRERMRRPLWRMISDWSAWQPLHHEVHLFYGREAWAQMQRLRPLVPVLLLQGACENKKGKPAELQYLPLGRLQILPDCGHMMNMEQPDAFNQAVLGFLQGR